MENPAKNILKFQARVAASLLSMKILILGFVWIHYHWEAAVVTFAIWLLAEKLLASGFYEGWDREIREHAENCQDCQDHGQKS